MEKLDIGDWLSIINLFVFIGGTTTGWFAHRRVSNRRLEKEHMAQEIAVIHREYSATLNDLLNDTFRPQPALIWFRLINIKVVNLMKLLAPYGIKPDRLHPYQVEFRELITNSPEFMSHYSVPGMLKISDRLRNELLVFQSRYSHLFNEMIRDVNAH